MSEEPKKKSGSQFEFKKGEGKIRTHLTDTLRELLESISKTLEIDSKKKYKFVFHEQIVLSKHQDIRYFYDEETYKFFHDKIDAAWGSVTEKKAARQIKIEELKAGENFKLQQSVLRDEVNKNLEICFNNLKNYIKDNLTDDMLKDEENRFQSLKDSEKEKPKHEGILCRNCKACDIVGVRYICSECDDFNICEKCESLNCHNQHFLIRINKPFDENPQIPKSEVFLNDICTNVELTLEEPTADVSFDATFFNIGSTAWSDCFCAPIAYGKRYLTGKKIPIEEKVERGKSINIKIPLTCVEQREFDTKWRLFTKEGIPFGDVFRGHVSVIFKEK